MNVNISALSMDRALNMAMQSESEAAELYRHLDKMVNNFVMKEKLKFLIFEEEKHYKMLSALYEKLFPEKPLQADGKSIFPRLKITMEENAGVPDLLELAMEAEKTAEEFYDSLAQEVDERGVVEILSYLSNMEHGHYALIKGEYELCLKDEAYFQRDDFQYDMVHIGP